MEKHYDFMIDEDQAFYQYRPGCAFVMYDLPIYDV